MDRIIANVNSSKNQHPACSNQFPLDRWEYVRNRPRVSGVIRAHPEDFQVNEILGFTPTGEGAHLWLKIVKNGMNTQDVARLLTMECGLRSGEVGYSGLKDRHAISCQWFSVPAGRNPARMSAMVADLCANHQWLCLKETAANPGKLKRGTHRHNEFEITVRNLRGDLERIDHDLAWAGKNGVPNYFGPQRFGRNGKNLLTAIRLFSDPARKLDRSARGMALSSARSWIFNQVLSNRVSNSTWNLALPGDAVQLAGTNSYFIHDGSDPSIIDRIAQQDLHPTGPLWGAGELPVRANAADFEKTVVNEISILPDGLVSAGLKQQRRALRVIPRQLSWQFIDGRELKISFSLPRGSYATAVLRHVVNVE